MARILVIEDNPTNLQLLLYLLQAFGYEVRGAREGEEGIELADQHRPDLILLDIHMPKMDGYEVASRLRSNHDFSSIPIVAVTALAMVGDRERLLASGFNGYISKPIDPETFASKVQQFLGSPPQAGSCCATTVKEGTAKEQRSEVSGAAKGLLLFVDNSPTNLQLARSILVPLGYEVITAPSVQEGIALARETHPDMIVSDVHMPHQDGYALIRLVHQDPTLRQTPFIFLSSSITSAREQERAITEGATKFLCRPLDPKVLIDEIEACLRPRAAP